MKKIIGYALLGLAALFILIQLVPYGRQHTNPPVVQEPQWASPQAREVARRACFDCHSNETVWPWYSHIAPVSWLVQHDVDEGRSRLNFSDWNGAVHGERGEAGEAAEEIGKVLKRGEMPPAVYLIQHPSAKLSEADKQTLLNGLVAVGQ